MGFACRRSEASQDAGRPPSGPRPGGDPGRRARCSARRRPDVLSPAELRAILTAASQERPRDGLLIRVLLESAVRVSELARLDVPDVDPIECTVRVRRGRGASGCVTLLTTALAQQILVHLAGRTRGPLFTSTRGTHLSVCRIRFVVHGAAHRAGIHPKRMSPHTFRSTWANRAWHAGMPIDTGRVLMNYASARRLRVGSPVTLDAARADYERAMSTIAAAPDGRAFMGAGYAG
jgi:integrase/recombinase XerD